MTTLTKFDVNVKYETENGFEVSIVFRSGEFEVAYWYGKSALQVSLSTDTLRKALEHAELLAAELEAMDVEREVMEVTRKELRIGEAGESLYDDIAH
jgi:hypothetical protein